MAMNRRGVLPTVYYPGVGRDGYGVKANDGYAPDAGGSRTVAFTPETDLWVARLVISYVTIAGGDDQIDMAIWDAARDSRICSTGIVTGISTTLTLAPKAVVTPSWLEGGKRYIAEIFHTTANATPGAVACFRVHGTVSTAQQALMGGATLLTQEYGKANPGAHSSIASMAGTVTSVFPLIGILST